MSYVSKKWLVCDAPDCDQEFLVSRASVYGWTVTGTGQHLCPTHSVEPEVPEAFDVKAAAAGDDR